MILLFFQNSSADLNGIINHALLIKMFQFRINLTMPSRQNSNKVDSNAFFSSYPVISFRYSIPKIAYFKIPMTSSCQHLYARYFHEYYKEKHECFQLPQNSDRKPSSSDQKKAALPAACYCFCTIFFSNIL